MGWLGDFLGSTDKKAGRQAQAQAIESGTTAVAAAQPAVTQAQTGLANIAAQQQDYAKLQQQAQGQAGQLGQQAATGAGVSAAQSGRAAGLNKGQAALLGAQQAGGAYGNVYGQNVQQGISNQQAGLGAAAGTTAQGANLAQQQAQLGLSAAGLQGTVGQNQLTQGAAQQNALISGIGQALSDERAKQDIHKSPDVTSILSKIRPVEYNYKPGLGKDSQSRVGVLAQDLEKTPMAAAVKEDASGLKSIDTTELIPMLLNMMKQQQDQINELKRGK